MATSRGHAPSTHTRLSKTHKRGHSAPIGLSPVADGIANTFARSQTPTTVFQDSWSDTHSSMTAAPSSHPLNLRPYLRKLSSSKDPNSHGLDLSRPAHENDLLGLGIAEYGASSRPVADVAFVPVNGRHRHTRSASSVSHYSTSSGLQRPTPLHSMRLPPQAYTPPLTRSTPPSVLGSEHEGDDFIMSDEEFRMRQQAYDPARRSGSLSSVPGLSLRINTNSSSTRLAGNYSQSSVSLSIPAAQGQIQPRPRGDTIKSMDSAVSPSSRTSFDQTSRFIRGGRDSPIDAASRAASIRAARLKFDEEERAKERKYEKEAHKKEERDLRKQQKKYDHIRSKSDTSENKHATSTSDVQNDSSSRPSVGGRQYSDHRKPHSNSLPNYVARVDPEKQNGATPKVTKSRAAKGTWLRFVAWFKTRLLRITRG